MQIKGINMNNRKTFETHLQARLQDKEYKYTRLEISAIVTEFMEAYKDCAIDGGIELTGFISAFPEHKESKECTNPKTGEKVMSKEKTVIKPKISPTFKNILVK